MTVDRIVACRRGRALIAVRVAVGARGVWSGRAVAAKIAAVTEAIPSKLPDAKPGQRIGSIRLDRDWDAVLLVTLDEHYEAEEIHEAARPAIKKRSRRPVQRRATSGVSCR